MTYVFYIFLSAYCALSGRSDLSVKVGPFDSLAACEQVRAHTEHAAPACIAQ